MNNLQEPDYDRSEEYFKKYTVPQEGRPVKEVIQETFAEVVNNDIVCTNQIGQKGLAERPFVHPLGVLGAQYEGIFGSPAFYWNCDGATSDL